jgi:peptide/nickel transport system substrate-binding protein
VTTKRSKTVALFGALVAVVAVWTGAASTATKATPKRGGTLTAMAGGPLASWDPATNPNTIPGIQSDRFNALYGTLMYLDSKGQLQPGMAQSLTSKDFKVWTLKLRPGVKFTDGTPYDAAAVKFNWDRIAAPTSAAVARLFASSFDTKVVNATTLQITLNDRPDPTLGQRVAELLGFIASPASLKSAGASYTNPVGAGPFKLDSWQAGVQETMVRNPGYWEKGKPYLDKITWRYVQDPAQRVATVVQGGAQYMNGYSFQFLNELKNSGFTADRVPAGGLRMFMFNMRRAPFKDVRARRAVALAVNSTELVRSLTQDPEATSWRSVFAKSSPFYSDKLLLPTQNLTQAQQLVDQVTTGGKDLEFTIVVAAVPELQRAGQLLQLQLNKLKGVKADLQTVALGDWRAATFTRHNFDITFYPGVYDLNGAEVSITGLLDTAGASNFAGYNSRKTNNTLASARAATNPARKKAYFAAVQKQYLAALPVVVFGLDYRQFFHTKKIAGFTTMGSGSILMKELYYTS